MVAQYPDDTDLIDALAAPHVRINPLLEFDWLRDGSYSTPVGVADYSDLSKILVKVDIETSTIVGDIPDQVNVVVGSSSGQMTLTLAGRRNAEEYTALELFSKYFVLNNPLAGYRKEGTPVRYSRSVRTAYGWRAIRQFTGWISEMPTLDEETGEVTIICNDAYDLQGAIAVLPRWAIGPSSDHLYPAITGIFSRMQQIDTSWVYSHLLQQGGRAYGVAPKSDTVALWSCTGSFLPSVGTLADTAIQSHWITYESPSGPWLDGAYGLAPYPATSTNNGNTNWNVCRAVQQYSVPRNGSTGDSPRWTEISWWGYSDGSGDPSTTVVSDLRMYLDSTSVQWPLDRGRVYVEVNRSGRTRLYIKEADALGRTWSWFYDTSLPQGWHYYSWIVAWTYNGITATLRIDDTVKTPTSTSLPALSPGFRYVQQLVEEEIGNQCSIKARTTIQHAMIRHSGTQITYDPNQKFPAQREGSAMAVMESSLTQLTFLPTVQDVSVWEVLKSVASAEMGALFLDEYGVLHFYRRDTVWNVENVNLSTVEKISRDKLAGLSMNQATNLYRNSVSITTTFTQQIRAVVWQSSDAKQFYAPDSAPYEQYFQLDQGVVSIHPGFNSISATPDTANGVSVDQVSVAAIRADLVTTPAPAGWAADTLAQADQRSVKILWSAQQSGAPLYIGSYLSANQPAYFIGGTKYDALKTQKFLYQDADDVQATGAVTLLDVPVNQWMQSQDATDKLAASLLRDLTVPAPVIGPIKLPADPRRQLLDVVEIDGGPMILGSIKAQVIGIHRVDDVGSDTAMDELTVRVLRTPSQALWDDPTLGFDVGTWGP
jgi:hypothetical protein